MPDRTKRYAYIDAVRGYAILMVIAVHTATHANLPVSLSKIVDQGARGVQLFFVASGLALCFSWTARNEGAGSFYVRRLFRIAPMFWLAIVFFVWLMGTGPRFTATEGIGIRHIAMTAMFIHGFWLDTINSVVPGGWSVADEAIFYALFPFFVPALLKPGWRTILIVAAVVIVAGPQLSRLDGLAHLLPKSSADTSGFYFFWWFPRQLPCFIFGIMLYKWSVERPLPAPAIAASLCILSIVLMLTLPFLMGIRYAMPLGPQTTYGAVFALFVFSLMSWKSSPLVNRVAVWIGKVSYSAYFIHLGLLFSFGLPRLSENAVLDFALAYTAVVAITVALSSVTYRFIEQPMIKFGNWVITHHAFKANGASLVKPDQRGTGELIGIVGVQQGE